VRVGLAGKPDSGDPERQAEDMNTESPGVTRQADRTPLPQLGRGASLILGLITLLLGVVLLFRPTQSLIAIAILLGIVMIVSGIYQIARALDGREHERVWRGISGVVFLLAGLALLRHLHLSIALIGLFIGFTWIIQGVMSLMEIFAGDRRGAETGWSVFFGIISLIAGIVVVSAPIASVGALTIFTGVFFIVLGAVEIIGGLFGRRARGQAGRGMLVPEQRSGTVTGGQAAVPDQSAAGRAAPGEPAEDVIRQGTGGQDTPGDSRPPSRNFPR
jgi:uncharacterized membrane protein HdeD (DUF308 family)